MNRGANGNSRALRPALSSPRARTHSNSDDAASAEHRRKLEALFSGGTHTSSVATASTTAHMGPTNGGNARVFSSPRRSLGRSPSEYRLRLERLRIAREPDEIKEAADTFLAFHQLPDDMEILLKVLQHPCERVLRDALGQISSLLIQGRANNTVILTDRLGEIGARHLEPATQSYIDGLRGQLATIERA